MTSDECLESPDSLAGPRISLFLMRHSSQVFIDFVESEGLLHPRAR
jgi:hypothetical protein